MLGKRQGSPVSPFLFSIMLEALASATRQEKEIKRIEREEKKRKTVDNMILCIEILT